VDSGRAHTVGQHDAAAGQHHRYVNTMNTTDTKEISAAI
jgi:hypothetical protein